MPESIAITKKIKWSQGDSNSWPPACHAGALPAELWPHEKFSVVEPIDLTIHLLELINVCLLSNRKLCFLIYKRLIYKKEMTGNLRWIDQYSQKTFDCIILRNWEFEELILANKFQSTCKVDDSIQQKN